MTANDVVEKLEPSSVPELAYQDVDANALEPTSVVNAEEQNAVEHVVVRHEELQNVEGQNAMEPDEVDHVVPDEDYVPNEQNVHYVRHGLNGQEILHGRQLGLHVY